jgi:hypothetical protein
LWQLGANRSGAGSTPRPIFSEYSSSVCDLGDVVPQFLRAVDAFPGYV